MGQHRCGRAQRYRASLLPGCSDSARLPSPPAASKSGAMSIGPSRPPRSAPIPNRRRYKGAHVMVFSLRKSNGHGQNGHASRSGRRIFSVMSPRLMNTTLHSDNLAIRSIALPPDRESHENFSWYSLITNAEVEPVSPASSNPAPDLQGQSNISQDDILPVLSG